MSQIQKLEKIKIWDIKQGDYYFTQREISSILSKLSISKSQAQLVAGTKVLHHVLPDLIPPVDRNYTLRFFGINTMLPSQKPAEVIFPHLFRPFVKIANSCRDVIKSNIDNINENWNTSFTKVIDNAIIGSFLGE